QNTGTAATSFTIALIDGKGTTVRTTPAANLNPGASSTYDLADDAALPAGFYSAVVNAASGGQVAVVTNMFTGPHGMLTYSGVASGAQKWLAPLFTSRLTNGLSTPVSVQNVSGGSIPAGGIKLNCVADPNSGGSIFSLQNDTAVGNTASAF